MESTRILLFFSLKYNYWQVQNCNNQNFYLNIGYMSPLSNSFFSLNSARRSQRRAGLKGLSEKYIKKCRPLILSDFGSKLVRITKNIEKMVKKILTPWFG